MLVVEVDNEDMTMEDPFSTVKEPDEDSRVGP
jgi:hypothetical protein